MNRRLKGKDARRGWRRRRVHLPQGEGSAGHDGYGYDGHRDEPELEGAERHGYQPGMPSTPDYARAALSARLGSPGHSHHV